MNVITDVPKSGNKIRMYGALWPAHSDPVNIEIQCIRRGGKWTMRDGRECGNGLFHHYRRGQELLWPEKKWHKWRVLSLEQWLEHTYVGEMGCSAAGKSDDAATDNLFDWYCFPECTTVLVASTTLQMLDVRVWGMVKRYHRQAKAMKSWIPGHLIEGARRIVQDEKAASVDGRDFRNGVIAVACRVGTSFVGLSGLVGLHNKRVHMIGDELQFMPRSFIDSISNLSKCEHFRFRGIGNPSETINAHGFICEPSSDEGGWEGGIDQRPGTKVWKTRMPDGVCIQKPGSDSPNMDVPEGEPVPFPFLITRDQMKADAIMWGIDDWHYTMFVEGRMPRGQGSHRVMTRQMCEKSGALNDPVWRDSNIKKVAFLDAAYRGLGGDRCVFGELQWGHEAESSPGDMLVSNLLSQEGSSPYVKTIIALVDLIVVPIVSDKGADEAEDQIVKFVMSQCEHRGIPGENFFFDSGMRTSLVTAFSRLWTPSVESVDCGGKAGEEFVSTEIQKRCCDYYDRKITELWYQVRMTVESKQFRGLTKDAMWEFCSREFKKVGGNKVALETKSEMKEKCGKSPDLADAVAVGIFGARKRGFVISKLGALRPDRGLDKWKQELRDKSKLLRSSQNLIPT